MLKNLSIGSRIYIMVCTFLLIMVMLLGGFYMASQDIAQSSAELSREQMFSLQENRIKDITEAAAEGLATLVQGKSPEEQMKIIQDFASKSRFDFEDTGYFFAYDGTTCIAHPVNGALVGKDLGNAQDKNGVYYVRQLARNANAGRDFVTFVFPKPNGELAPKLGFSTNIPGTPYWIGTGVYVELVDVLVKDLMTSMEESAFKDMMFIIIGLVVLVLLVVPACISVINSITRPLGALTKISSQVADGDLNVTINDDDASEASKNEVLIMSRALSRMVLALKEKIAEAEEAVEESKRNAAQIQDALHSAAKAEQSANAKTEHLLDVAASLDAVAERLAATTQALSTTIDECEAGAAQQASQITDTSSAMDEMDASVRRVAENASSASQVSASTGGKAHDGQAISSEAVKSMQDVQGLTTHLMEDMQKLDVSAKSIDQVMGVISEIADQTNLLALNAAIEAARAGEAGRGFAVVADEVRKLAEKTMASTNEVAKIIAEIQQHASQSLLQTKASYEAIEKATSLVGQSGDTLAEIYDMTKNSAEQVQAIAHAADEQSSTTQNISMAMSQVNEIALITSRNMNSATLSVQELASQAHELTELTRSMKNI